MVLVATGSILLHPGAGCGRTYAVPSQTIPTYIILILLGNIRIGLR
jgi:hypothetical protein